MAHFIISYDLHKNRDYRKIISSLEASGAVRLLQSLWLIEFSLGAASLRFQLTAKLDDDDSLAVIELKSGSEWATIRARADGNTWLQRHIRTY